MLLRRWPSSRGAANRHGGEAATRMPGRRRWNSVARSGTTSVRSGSRCSHCSHFSRGRGKEVERVLRRSVLDTREDDGPSASGAGVGPRAIDKWAGGVCPFAAGWRKVMMWWFIVTDGLLFAGFLASYGYARIIAFRWPDQ